METITRDLEGLSAFHAVASEASFSRAAILLGTSKAMVSKHVRRLESYLGSQLFHRTTRRVSLSEEGLALFSYSQKIFSLSDEATRRITDISRGSSGVIKLAAPVSLGEVFFPSILSELEATIPQVEFEIDLSNQTRDFVKDRIDFAIRASEVHAPDLIARYLGRIKDAVCVSPAHLKKVNLSEKKFIDPRDLARCNCILNSHQKAWNTWTFTRGSEDVSIEVRGSFATNQYTMARSLCLQGMGITKLPFYLVADDIAAGKLLRLFSDHEISTHPLYLVYLRSDYSAKKKKLTRDAILNWFKRNDRYLLDPGQKK